MEAAAREYDNFRADTIKQLMEAFGRRARRHGHAAVLDDDDVGEPGGRRRAEGDPAPGDHAPRAHDAELVLRLDPQLARPGRLPQSLPDRRAHGATAAGARVGDLEVPAPIIAGSSSCSRRITTSTSAPRSTSADAALVEFSPDALERSRLFERKMLDLSIALDREGLGDMPIRAREIGLRLALICTLSDTPDTPVITTDIVDWCFSYVEYFLHQTLHALRTRVADSATERTRNRLLEAIRAAGARGISTRDYHRGKAFIGIPMRERREAIDSLIAAELVAWTTVDAAAKGRPAAPSARRACG
jgi:hypothetical protein